MSKRCCWNVTVRCLPQALSILDITQPKISLQPSSLDWSVLVGLIRKTYLSSSLLETTAHGKYWTSSSNLVTCYGTSHSWLSGLFLFIYCVVLAVSVVCIILSFISCSDLLWHTGCANTLMLHLQFCWNLILNSYSSGSPPLQGSTCIWYRALRLGLYLI